MDSNNLQVLFSSLPGRYAKALFNEGKKLNCLEVLTDNFEKLEMFFKNNGAVKNLLTSRCLNKKDIDEGWRVLGDYLSFCPIFLAFIRQVGLNQRFDFFKRMKFIFNIAVAKYKNKRNVDIISNVELLPEQKKQIEKLITKIFEEKTLVNYKVDGKILGGFKITSEEIVIDASVLSQIKQLSNFYKSIKIKVPDNEN